MIKLIKRWRTSKDDEIIEQICNEMKNGSEHWLNISLMKELKRMKSMEIEEVIEELPGIYMECYELKIEKKKITDKKIFCRTCSTDTSIRNLTTHRYIFYIEFYIYLYFFILESDIPSLKEE